MEKIRKGNDIEVQWAIYAGYGINEAPYDLTGRNLTLYLRNQFGRHEIYEYTIDKHIIRFMYWGKDQKQTGTYSIELVENEGREGMHTVDECDAFTLVNHSCQTGGDSEGRVECIHLQFRANMGISIPNNGGGETPSIEVDNVLSETSENPVQNKVVTKAINELSERIEGLESPVDYSEAIKANADAIKANKEAIEANSKAIRDNADAITEIEGNIAGINSEVVSISTRQNEAEQTMATLSNKVDELSEKVDNIKPSEGADVIYESSIEDKTLEMPSAVGGLSKGTTVESLEGKTFSQMFDDILFPTVNPTFTAPTASIQFKNYTSTKEVGSDAPTASNFTTSYNAGAITLNGVKQNNRGGAIDSDNSFIYVNGDADNKTLPAKVSLGATTYKYRASYSEGPQPKDNKGNDYDAPLAAGYVDSSAVTLNGTYPWFASTASASAENPVAKQTLVAWNATAGSMSTGNFELQPSGTLPQVFKLPRKISTLQMLNTVSNKMETIGLGDYNETTETINIGGVDVTYYVYTYKGAVRGSVTLSAKF